ncbi:hypothetical protein J2Z50_003406 [Ensifer mexicanus]|nr:hypothetical protein [Sinorhizobium mexicanum]
MDSPDRDEGPITQDDSSSLRAMREPFMFHRLSLSAGIFFNTLVSNPFNSGS